MRKIVAIIAVLIGAFPLYATTITVSGSNVQDSNGLPLFSGQWCFNATCLTVTQGSFSGTVTAGTSAVTILNASSTTILTVTPVTLSASYSWNTFTVPLSITYSGNGQPYLACQLQASYTQNDSSPTGAVWTCKSQSGRLVWSYLGPPTPIGPGVVSGYGAPTVSGIVPTVYVRTDADVTYVLTGQTGAVSTNWYAISGSSVGYSFDNITSGTNISAAMLVGTGGSLGPTGSGTVSATSIVGSSNSGWYNSAINTTTAIALANNAVIVTNGLGVPSASTTLPSNIAAANMALTTPSLGTPVSGEITNLTGTCASCQASTVTGLSSGLVTASTANAAGITITPSVTAGVLKEEATVSNAATARGALGLANSGTVSGDFVCMIGTTGQTTDCGLSPSLVVTTTGIQNVSGKTLTGSTINGTPIGGTTPAAGAFTTLNATTPLPISSGGCGANSVTGCLTALGDGAAPTGTGGIVLTNSPTLTGTPTAPTQPITTNNTSIATTAAVTTALAGYAPAAGSANYLPSAPPSNTNATVNVSGTGEFCVDGGGSCGSGYGFVVAPSGITTTFPFTATDGWSLGRGNVANLTVDNFNQVYVGAASTGHTSLIVESGSGNMGDVVDYVVSTGGTIGAPQSYMSGAGTAHPFSSHLAAYTDIKNAAGTPTLPCLADGSGGGVCDNGGNSVTVAPGESMFAATQRLLVLSPAGGVVNIPANQTNYCGYDSLTGNVLTNSNITWQGAQMPYLNVEIPYVNPTALVGGSIIQGTCNIAGYETVAFTGTVSTTSAVITSPSTTQNLAIGQTLTGTGIATGATITSLSPLTMSANATANGTPTITAAGGAKNFHISNLGIDVGANVVAAIYSGSPQFGLTMANFPQTTSVEYGGTAPCTEGVQANNIISLGDGTSASQHAILFENDCGASFTNLWSYLDGIGIVFKTTDSTMININASGHAIAAGYMKGDVYAPNHGNKMIGGMDHYLNTVGDTGGWDIDAGSANVGKLDIEDMHFEGTSVGFTFEFDAANGQTINDVNIHNTQFDGISSSSAPVFQFYTAGTSTANNVNVTDTTARNAGWPVLMTETNAWNNVNFSNFIGQGFSQAGMDLSGTNINVDNSFIGGVPTSGSGSFAYRAGYNSTTTVNLLNDAYDSSPLTPITYLFYSSSHPTINQLSLPSYASVANQVFASPCGASGPFSPRALCAADVSGLGLGTVSSVAMTMPGVLFNATVPGSPITTSGTLAPTLLSQAAYTFFCNGTSASTTPTFCSATTALTALGGGTAPVGTGGVVLSSALTPSNLTITYNASGTTTFAAANAVVAGGLFTATHSTSTTFNPTGLVAWGSYTAVVKQDSTGGGNTFTLGTSGSCATWRKPGGGGAVTSLTLGTTASTWDVLAFTFDGTNCILTQGTGY